MKVALAGAGGRMGRTLIDAVLADRELELGAAIDVAGGAHGAVKITSDASAAASCDVLIDFTRPEGTLANLKHARAMVIGTTGFSATQRDAIAQAAKRMPIVMAANFAVGVKGVPVSFIFLKAPRRNDRNSEKIVCSTPRLNTWLLTPGTNVLLEVASTSAVNVREE